MAIPYSKLVKGQQNDFFLKEQFNWYNSYTIEFTVYLFFFEFTI